MRSFAFWICIIANSLLFGQSSLDHLEPVPPQIWHWAVRPTEKVLVPSDNAVLWMIANPAFEPEFATSISKYVDRNGDCSYKVNFAFSKIQIVAPPPPPPLPGEKTSIRPRFDRRKHVVMRSAPIQRNLAELVIKAWEKAVTSTRYAHDSALHIGCDGITYNFYFDRWYYGTTWCPESGVPRLIADLGLALADFVDPARQAHKDASQNLQNISNSIIKHGTQEP